jgi:ArsR family transcriptional regulator
LDDPDDLATQRARSDLVTDETAIVTSALRFLSDANRLRLLTCLAQQEACVFELTGHLDLPQSLVSYHLKRLREAGLVRPQRRAHRIYYELDPVAWDTFTQPIREMCGIVTAIGDEAESSPVTPQDTIDSE